MQPSEDRFIAALNDLTTALRHGFVSLCQRVERLEQGDRANAEILSTLTRDLGRIVDGVAALRHEQQAEHIPPSAPPRREPGQSASLRVIEGGGA